MTTKLTALALSVAWLLLTAVPVPAQELRYWGAPQDPSIGLIELGGQMFSVRAGDVIPSWGVVETVGADELIVRRSLSDDEKNALKAEGKAVYDAQHLRVRTIQRMLPQSIP